MEKLTIIYALIIALSVLFWHSCTWEGHIFSGIKKIIKPEWKIAKPIYSCPICCTPWWGSLIFFLFFPFSVPVYLLTITTAAGMNVLSVLLIDIRDYYVKAKKKLEE